MKGLDTCDNDRFMRLWHEVNINDSGIGKSPKAKWYPYCKGGGFRKWYGNWEYLVNWEHNGYELRNLRNQDGSMKSRPQNIDYYFKDGITFSSITSSIFSCRKMSKAIFGGGGSAIFTKNDTFLMGFLNSKLNKYFLNLLNPTLNILVGDIEKLPILNGINIPDELVDRIIQLHKVDWNSFETSWDFGFSPFHYSNQKGILLSEIYNNIRKGWQETTQEAKILEEELNSYLIKTYGLNKELNSTMPIEEITLSCNTYYRFPGERNDEEREILLRAETIREFLSYSVGCMFGRYSLDKSGLILANQGETLQDYLRQVPDPTFLPDEDNAIPVLDGEWFSDDITERFKKFLRVTFGEQHYEENLAFIEQAIGRDIRSYFVKEFYSQHVKMYQKRPIYWMFSSPRGSFNVLIYMHRYKPDTISVILNRYLREFRGKLEGRKAHLEQVSISASSTQREKTAALKEIEGLNKTLEELRVYERDVLYPLAVQGIQIDLDDGVKVNYKKFGKALAKVNGLSE